MRFKVFVASFGLIFLSATPADIGRAGTSPFQGQNFMIVWNVGQGQWATLKDRDGCHHFDMGGEFSPLKKVAKLCAGSQNYIHLSHWDWDHISFVERSAKFLPQRCLALGPLGNSSAHKVKPVRALSPCRGEGSLSLRELTDFHEARVRSSNDSSHVLMASRRFLIPGDSGSAQERVWSQRLSLASVRWLLLGHHGSRTATSEALLQTLPGLQVAVASARARRYGHPHLEVVAELRHHHVALLKTEDWGNLWFEIPPSSR